MDTKQKRIFKGIFKTAQANAAFDAKTLTEGIAETFEADFDCGVALWEFCLEFYADLFVKDSSLNRALTAGVFNQLVARCGTAKAYRLLAENNAIKKAVFLQSNSLCDYDVVSMLTTVWMQQKTDLLNEYFKLMQKNTFSGQTFGETLLFCANRFFAEAEKKQGVKNFTLTKKQCAVLQENAEKVKGPQKAVLLQRLKELN